MKKIKKKFMTIFVLVITGFISTAQNEKISITSSSEEAVQLYHRAWSVMENAEIAKAHQLLEDALKEDPEFFMGHFMLAFNNLYFGNQTAFKEHAEKALNSKAALSKGEMLLKTALRRINENPKADVTDVGENLVEIYPTDEVAYFMMASFQGIVKDFEGSAETYVRLLQIAENKAPVYNMMGYNYMQLNDFEAAEKAFDKYIELFPGHPNPHDSKGDYFMAVKDYKNAHNSFMKAHELNNVWSYKKAMKAKELMEKEMVTDGGIPFTAGEILEKSIQFHDPDGKWKNFSGALKLIFTNPNGYTAGTEIIEIDVNSDFYKCTRIQGGIQYVKGIKDGKSFISFNGDSHPTTNQIEEFGLNKGQIEQMKDWHFFHFGKMMFLKEIGAELLGEVTKKDFNGKDCYQITLNVPEERVKIQSLKGKNVFHLDANNFELAGFQNSLGTAFYNGSLEINGLKTAIVGRYYSPDNHDFFGVDLFSRADDHFRLPLKYQTQSKPNGSNNGLKSTHLLKLENEDALRKLELPLKEINETLAEMGYPECGYVIYKVNDDYESEYTHIMEGWWMCKEVYDETHNHAKYKALAEKYDDLFAGALQNQEYFRVEKMMPKLY